MKHIKQMISFFETQETYTIGYLSKIKDFINKDIVDNKIKLVSR